MSASDRQLLRGRREASGPTVPSIGLRPAKGLAAHAAALMVVVLAGVVFAVLPLVRQAEMERQPEIPWESAPAPGVAGTVSPDDRLQVIDEALAQADVRRARSAWHDAYRVALRRSDWEEMAALGDAALQRGASGQQVGETEARQAYLASLFRARARASLEGVMRATEAFATLGDRDVVEEGLRIAESLAKQGGNPDGRERVMALRARLEGPVRVPDSAGPSLPASWEPGP
jgi:hypothetical protein